MNYCVIVSLVLSVCCGLRGAALPEQPVRDIKRTKLYAAICAKVQQHLLPSLAKKVAEYCDNDFPLVKQRKFVSQGVIRCTNFFDERYLLVGQEGSTKLTVVDVQSEQIAEIETRHKRPLTAVSRIDDDVIATGSDGQVCVWDINEKKYHGTYQMSHETTPHQLLGFNKLVVAVCDDHVGLIKWVDPCGSRRIEGGEHCFVVIRDSQGNAKALGDARHEVRIDRYLDDYLPPYPPYTAWPRSRVVRDFENGKFSVLQNEQLFVNCGGEIFWIENVISGQNNGRHYCNVYSVKKVAVPCQDKIKRASYQGTIRRVVVSPAGDAMAFVTDADNIQVFKTTDGVLEEKLDDEFIKLLREPVVEQKPRKKKRDWCTCS